MNAVRPASKPSLVAALGLVLAACTASTSGSPVAQPSSSATGGTLRIGIGGSADSLNPGLALLAEAFELFELVYDTPLAITDEGEYVPELATEWGVADDGVTWTVTIRDDVKFHDGTPLTAEDVAFSILLYRDNEDFPYQSSYPDVFETVVAVDPTHVEIVTSEPIGNMEYRLLYMYVLPKHIWENEDPLTFENTEMIGSGPFKLVEFESEVAEQLAANEDYYAGRPIIDEVIFQTFSNADARVAALTNGDIDLLAEFPVTAIANLRNADNVEVFISEIAAGGGFTDIIFNVLDDENCPPDDPETEEADGGVCSGHPALKEVEVRQALAMATNKQEFIDLTWLGEAAPGLGLVPNGLVEFYAADLEDYAFDSEAAAQMLEDAGYVDENDDGIRECKASQDCDDLTFRLNYATDSDTYPREAETLQGQWREVGVELEIQGLDADTVTSVCCPAFDYDVLIWGWGSDPDPQFLSGILLCSEITTGLSETGYCNPEYDDLYAQQGVEIDQAARADLIKEMQAIALRDVPYIIPYYERIIVAFRTDTFTNWPLGDPNLGLTDPSSLLVVRPTE